MSLLVTANNNANMLLQMPHSFYYVGQPMDWHVVLSPCQVSQSKWEQLFEQVCARVAMEKKKVLAFCSGTHCCMYTTVSTHTSQLLETYFKYNSSLHNSSPFLTLALPESEHY